MKTYKDTQEIIQKTFRLSKADSSYLYFMLESNEGLAFYSTLPFDKGDETRDIIINILPEHLPQVENIFKECSKRFEMNLLAERTIKDSL
jgi:hypothetical protein